MPRAERLIIIVGLLALTIIPSIVLYVHRDKTSIVEQKNSNTIPTPGAPGAMHAHISFVVNILGQQQAFTDVKKYMLQSKLVHFEDNNPLVMHKHTTGITVPFFLLTLKIGMTKDCIDFQDREPSVKYCTNATNTLRMIVNGNEVPDPERYDVQNNDRILVTYGPETGVRLKLLFNQVPPVPEFSDASLHEIKQDAASPSAAPGDAAPNTP
jgi:hypothetical protein